MPERFAVYRYPPDTKGPDDGPRYTFTPVEGAGTAGRQAPTSDAATVDDGSESARPVGHVEAPDGTRIAETEPPVLEVPGHGRVDVSAVIGVTEGHATADRVLRWHPGR